MRNQKGAIKPIICIIILIIISYIGYKFVIPYYRYFAFKSDAKEIARLSFRNTERYKEMICERAKALNIPIECGDISVSKSDISVAISTAWSETVYFPGGYSITLNFKVDVEE